MSQREIYLYFLIRFWSYSNWKRNSDKISKLLIKQFEISQFDKILPIRISRSNENSYKIPIRIMTLNSYKMWRISKPTRSFKDCSWSIDLNLLTRVFELRTKRNSHNPTSSAPNSHEHSDSAWGFSRPLKYLLTCFAALRWKLLSFVALLGLIWAAMRLAEEKINRQTVTLKAPSKAASMVVRSIEMKFQGKSRDL